jgi:hypothetical protein
MTLTEGDATDSSQVIWGPSAVKEIRSAELRVLRSAFGHLGTGPASSQVRAQAGFPIRTTFKLANVFNGAEWDMISGLTEDPSFASNENRKGVSQSL